MRSEGNFQESELSLHHASEIEPSPQAWHQAPLSAERLTCSVIFRFSLLLHTHPRMAVGHFILGTF